MSDGLRLAVAHAVAESRVGLRRRYIMSGRLYHVPVGPSLQPYSTQPAGPSIRSDIESDRARYYLTFGSIAADYRRHVAFV